MTVEVKEVRNVLALCSQQQAERMTKAGLSPKHTGHLAQWALLIPSTRYGRMRKALARIGLSIPQGAWSEAEVEVS